MRDTLSETIIRILTEHQGLSEAVSRAMVAEEHPVPPTAALMMVCLGGQELSPKEIMHRSYYVGTNFTYTLRMLGKAGFIIERPSRDKRTRKICLTKAGDSFAARVRQRLSDQSVNTVREVA